MLDAGFVIWRAGFDSGRERKISASVFSGDSVAGSVDSGHVYRVRVSS